MALLRSVLGPPVRVVSPDQDDTAAIKTQLAHYERRLRIMDQHVDAMVRNRTAPRRRTSDR